MDHKADHPEHPTAGLTQRRTNHRLRMLIDQMQAGIVENRLDRRSPNRLTLAPCRICNAPPEHIRVTTRTSHFLYLKCTKCRNVWQIGKAASGPSMRWTPSRSR